jgi:hypothetical protein
METPVEHLPLVINYVKVDEACQNPSEYDGCPGFDS